ncbi:unnamed protein product [Callosobruchus maculatus]|uniref:RNase H type-1 domain-containing protein n=1 Tax=Callosobruchus maculatus TaxID=64391 RepID=A0A653BPM8_CALMS|nr:unnamed protein product [Callosobruchus maculatus]
MRFRTKGNNKDFETIIRDRELCEVNNLHREIVWYTDGSKTEQGTGAGIFGRGTKQSIALGKYASVFQSEDELVRLGSSALYIGAEPALGVPKSTIRHQVGEWMKHQHKEQWNLLPGCVHGKIFIKAPCKKRAETLLSLNRNQLQITTGLLTGHCGVKKHLNKMGPYNGDLNCRLCGRGTESALQVLCECEALAHKSQQLFEKTKLEPMEYSSAPGPVGKLHKLMQGSRLLKWIVDTINDRSNNTIGLKA